MNKQKLIFVVGPDMVGKSQIAKELAQRLGITYFKASSEHTNFLGSRKDKSNHFINDLRYADPRLFDFLKQSGGSVVFDRGYPCEYVYSSVLGRETDIVFLLHMDKEWASLNARIVFCNRSSYTGITDDLDSSIDSNVLSELDKKYREFLTRTKCKFWKLNVDDENLDREVNEIVEWLEDLG